MWTFAAIKASRLAKRQLPDGASPSKLDSETKLRARLKQLAAIKLRPDWTPAKDSREWRDWDEWLNVDFATLDWGTPDDIVGTIKELAARWGWQQSTISTNAYCVLGLLRDMDVLTAEQLKDLRKVFQAWAAECLARRNQNAPPEVLKENPDVSWERLQEYERELRTSAFGSQRHLVVAFRTLAGPFRDDQLDRLVFVDELPAWDPQMTYEDNYCVVSEDKVTLEFRRHKAVHTTRERLLVELTGDSPYAMVAPHLPLLGDIIKDSLAKQPRKTMFNQKVSYLTRQTSDAAFGVPGVYCQVLRRLFHKHWFDTRHTKEELDLMSTLVGHSPEESQRYDIVDRNEEGPQDPQDSQDAPWEAAMQEIASQMYRMMAQLADSVDERLSAMEEDIATLRARIL